jgi:hypothetical protein
MFWPQNGMRLVATVCGTQNGGAEWTDHMTFYSSFNSAPIFSDISNCTLANISWVIPDIAWSDHPAFDGTGGALGPSWVGDIINAIGASYTSSNHVCDYWGANLPAAQAEPTAVFVVWDDWGGFFDHVQPPNVWTGTANGSSWSCPAPNQWGCGYTYGFRVPLLVVSEYTGTLSGTTYGGYISGACGTAGKPSCPNASFPYVHDFGSILAFTEYNFALNPIVKPYYADYNALDWGSARNNIPLSDFFQLYTGSGSGRPFVQIPVVAYGPSFFQGYYATHSATPTGPDTD